MADISDLRLWELYDLLEQAGRLHLDPATDVWFLDGAEITASEIAELTATFRRAASSCFSDGPRRSQ